MADKENIKKESAARAKRFGRIGQNIPFIVICILLFGLAVPLLLVFFLKSPQPQQHMLILGVSYYKIVFIFLLSAAAMVYVSVFFLRANPFTIVFLFILSLSCSFPLIVGLRNNLTLQQTILEIPFFSGWPFFLNPGYVLIEFLIPAGIIIYLFLQINGIFSKKPRGYVFFGAAVYLSIAAFIGFSSLNQAGQPNIMAALAGQKRGVETPMQDYPSGKNISQPTNKLKKLPIQPLPDETDQESSISKPFQPIPTMEPESDIMAAVVLHPEVQVLSDKVDRILESLKEIENFYKEHQEKLLKENDVVSQGENSESQPSLTKKDSSEDEISIVDLHQKVQVLSEKIDLIFEAIGKMAALLPERQEVLQKNDAMAEEEQASPETSSQSVLRSEKEAEEKGDGTK